jgi:deoxyadenosine/deoxycytidine kinase
MSAPFPYQYICIEGNIGTGKTSLCEKIAVEFNCQLIMEEFADNPFLKYFYEDPERYAFTVELFFMTERHKQLQHDLHNRSLFSEFMVADYFFWKTVLFASKTLHEQEYRLFLRLFHILNNNFPNPDLLVYLHRSPEKLLRQIQSRGRPYEQTITTEYLQRIQDSYFEYFRNQLSYPILILEVEDLDFIHNADHYKEILRLMRRTYTPGVHRISMRL